MKRTYFFVFLLLITTIVFTLTSCKTAPADKEQTTTETKESESIQTDEEITDTVPESTTSMQGRIVIDWPLEGAQIEGSTFELKGQAQVFEGALNWRIKDGEGKVLKEGLIETGVGAPEWGDFSEQITVDGVAGTLKVTLEVYEESMSGETEYNDIAVVSFELGEIEE